MAQPVVRVPATCEVVVTGTGVGVVAGFGGQVGQGGVVAMPDPFDLAGVAGDFNIIANGTVGHTWRMEGDLSIQTASLVTPILTGAGLTQNIESFNKNQRPYEGVLPSTMSLARSKGRVTIGYTIAPCNAAISFEVFKRYPNTGSGAGYVPPIIGPNCWDVNTLVTYSVDAVASDNLTEPIGTDTYYWTVTSTPAIPGGILYYSSDRSSITFRTPLTPVTGTPTITACYGRANAWDGDLGAPHTTCTTKTLTPAATPTFSVAPPTCLNTGITTFTATVAPIAGYNYVWSYIGSGTPTVVASGTQNSTVTVSSMNNNPGKLTLTVTNSNFCPVSQYFEYTVNRNFVTPLALTSVPTTLCLAPLGTFTVSLPATAQLNNTTWTMPTGWTFVPSNPPYASIITVTVPAGALGGAYVISAKSTACPAGSISLTAYVKPAPVFTAGPTCIASGSVAPITYTVSAPGPGPFTYAWTIPAGWAGTSTTNTITVTPNGTGVGNVTCNVCTGGTCCTSITRTVGFNPVTPTINSPTCFNVGLPGTAVFTVAAPIAGTYTWTVSGAFGTASVFTGTSFTVTTIGTPGTYVGAVTCTHSTTGCGSSAAASATVTLTPNGTLNVTNGPGFQSLSISGYLGGSTFQWLQNCGVAGEVVCTGCGTSFVTTLTNAATAGQWGAYVIASGCTTRVCTTTLYGNRMAQNADNEAEFGTKDAMANEVTLSPNPNGGDFAIRVKTVQQSSEMVMFDAFGQKVFQAVLNEGNNKFNQSRLASGMYFIHIVVDGKVTVKRMEIMH